MNRDQHFQHFTRIKSEPLLNRGPPLPPAAVQRDESSNASLSLVGQTIAKRPAPLTFFEPEGASSPGVTPLSPVVTPLRSSSTVRRGNLSTPSSGLVRTASAPCGEARNQGQQGHRPTTRGRFQLCQSPLGAGLGAEFMLNGMASPGSPVRQQSQQSLTTPSSKSREVRYSLGAHQLTPHAVAMCRRRVTFCPTPGNTYHAITPYSKIYGKHPGLFHFDRQGEMELSDAGVMEELRRNEDLYNMPSPD